MSRRDAYTLIEVLAAFFVLTVILTMVSGIFIESGRQQSASLARMNLRLAAASALQQLEEDLDGAVLVNPRTGGRPDENPSRFVADASDDAGATRLRWTTQNAPSANRVAHSGGWVEVAYFVEEDLSGERTLWRWLSPRPPAAADAPFPDAETPGAMRLATAVERFGIRFQNALGEWVDEWDSAYESPDAPLPAAAEISLQLRREARPGETEDGAATIGGPTHQRRVVLPMPPFDIAALLELSADDEDEGGPECFTVADCLAAGDSAWYEEALSDDCDGDEDLCELLDNPDDTCFDDVLRISAGLAVKAPEACSE